MRKPTALLPLLLATLLAACGDKPQNNLPNTPEGRALAEKMRQVEAANQAARAKAQRDANLPKPDRATAAEQYREITSDAQLMEIYYALSGLPVPWDRLLEKVSNDFRRTQDGFQRQEIMQALKPKLEQEMASYAQNRYVAISARVRLSPYDFGNKGFPVSGFDPGSYLSFSGSNYVLQYENGPEFRLARIPDEAKAREIESIRAANPYQDYRARLYLFARDAGDDGGRYAVRAQVVKVVVQKPDGSIWFEY